VTQLPSEALGFRAVGELQRLNAPRAASSAGVAGWLRRFFGPPTNLADHAAINYVDRIAALVVPSEYADAHVGGEGAAEETVGV
jgi:hypothetical protein